MRKTISHLDQNVSRQKGPRLLGERDVKLSVHFIREAVILIKLDQLWNGEKLLESAVHLVPVHPTLDDEVVDATVDFDGECELCLARCALADKEAIVTERAHLGDAVLS